MTKRLRTGTAGGHEIVPSDLGDLFGIYETGSFTPTVTHLTTPVTLTTAVGQYTKVGTTIHFYSRVVFTEDITSGGANQLGVVSADLFGQWTGGGVWAQPVVTWAGFTNGPADAFGLVGTMTTNAFLIWWNRINGLASSRSPLTAADADANTGVDKEIVITGYFPA